LADYAPEVVKAVILTLKASPDVDALVGGAVFTDVPQEQEFPYIQVGCQSEPFAASDFSGQRHIVRIQARSRKAGMKEAIRIRAAAHAALDRQEDSIILDAGTLIKCEYAGLSDAFIEDDGKTWQALCEFELLTM
jgi:hypothetical protein